MHASTRDRARPRPFLVLLAGGLLAASLAACTGAGPAPTVPTMPQATGSPGASPSGSSGPAASKDPRDAMLAYTKCMRDHGVDFPDPQTDSEGGQAILIDPTAPGFQEAQKACDFLMPPIGNAMDPASNQKFQDQMLAFARCMRDHGVDMPDPKFDGTGAAAVGGNINPSTPAFQAAQKACGSNLPAGGTITSGGGGPVTAP